MLLFSSFYILFFKFSLQLFLIEHQLTTLVYPLFIPVQNLHTSILMNLSLSLMLSLSLIFYSFLCYCYYLHFNKPDWQGGSFLSEVINGQTKIHVPSPSPSFTNLSSSFELFSFFINLFLFHFTPPFFLTLFFYIFFLSFFVFLFFFFLGEVLHKQRVTFSNKIWIVCSPVETVSSLTFCQVSWSSLLLLSIWEISSYLSSNVSFFH